MTMSQSGYKVMPRSRIERGGLVIRAVALLDIERIRQWRNAQMDVLRQSSLISPGEQERYFAEHVWPEMGSSTPNQILFSIEKDGGMIGYGGLVNISWIDQTGEVSFLLNPAIERNLNQRSQIFLSFLEILKEIAFNDLQLCRIWTETYATREFHIKTLEVAGFQNEGCLRNHSIINGDKTNSIVHGLIRENWNETAFG